MFSILLSVFLLSIANQQSEEEAHEVGPHADDGIGLIINIVVDSCIEDLVRLEEDILALEDSEAHDYGDEHEQSEKDVAEGLLGAIYDEEGCSEEGEEDVGLHYPQPWQTGLSIKL